MHESYTGNRKCFSSTYVWKRLAPKNVFRITLEMRAEMPQTKQNASQCWQILTKTEMYSQRLIAKYKIW